MNLKNKRGQEGGVGMNVILWIIVGLIVIGLVISLVMGVSWGKIIKNFLPKFNSTSNVDDYSVINGSDNVVFVIPKNLPNIDNTQRAEGGCSYYTVKYSEGLFGIFNSSGYRIGAFQKVPSSQKSWEILDVVSFIKIYTQGVNDDSGVLNTINYAGFKDDGAINFIFDGNNIICGNSGKIEVVDSSVSGVKKDISYYVSDKDCFNTWNTADEHCIVESDSSGKTRNTNFYLTQNKLEAGKKYALNAKTGMIGLGNSKNLCYLTVGSLVKDCLIVFANSGLYGESINMQNRILQEDGFFVLQKDADESVSDIDVSKKTSSVILIS